MTSKYGLHSKLTGAGGGGCAFTLVTPGNIKGTELSKLRYSYKGALYSRKGGELPYETYGYVYCLSWVACAQTPPPFKNISPNFFFREGVSLHRLPYGCKVSADFGLTYGF